MFTKRNNKSQQQQQQDNKNGVENPIKELNRIIDRTEKLLQTARADAVKQQQKKLKKKPDSAEKKNEDAGGASSGETTTPPTSTSTIMSMFTSQTTTSNVRGGGADDDDCCSADSGSFPWSNENRKAMKLPSKPQDAMFATLSFKVEQELVDNIRRIAALVMEGDRRLVMQQGVKEGLSSLVEEEGGEQQQQQYDAHQMEKDIALFETFCERNVLSMFVTIATGIAFTKLSRNNNNNNNATIMVPPFAVATQAVKAVASLIQNVSRPTSLYFLLSNDRLNDLIRLPLELYGMAEASLVESSSSSSSTSLSSLSGKQQQSSPEMMELSTHFVSFLKSLVVRINADTLQFFFSYPTVEERAMMHEEEDNNNDNNEEGRASPSHHHEEVRFPLYERALEFCAAQNEPLVRITAMFICLCTLRLTTAEETVEVEEDNHSSVDKKQESSHKSAMQSGSSSNKVLPLSEQLTIAAHVCTPSRVEQLVGPIFTRLAQLWGKFEALVRENDALAAHQHQQEQQQDHDDDDYDGDDKEEEEEEEKEMCRNRERMVYALKDIVNDVQNELSSLEDVFKVGLTPLNEQTIEIMLASFVYPLLLQPLLQCDGRLSSSFRTCTDFISSLPQPARDRAERAIRTASQQASYSSSSNNNNNKNSSSEEKTDQLMSDAHENEIPAVATKDDTIPAKTAHFAIAATFHMLTHRSLLNMIWTTLMHPLALELTSNNNGRVIRVEPEVCDVSPEGEIRVHRDRQSENGFSYSFGRGVVDDDNTNTSSSNNNKDHLCAFVLAPALADIMEGTTTSASSTYSFSKSQPNPYRKVILSSLAATDGLKELQSVTILSMDAALSALKGQQLASDILFGSRMTPSQQTMALRGDAAGGEAGKKASRRSPSTPGSKHMKEVIASMSVGVMNALETKHGTWMLEFNPVAANALLCALGSDPVALKVGCKLVERRRRQSESFVSQLPSRLALHFEVPPELDPQQTGKVMDRVFFGTLGNEELSVAEHLTWTGNMNNGLAFSAPIGRATSFDDMTHYFYHYENRKDMDEPLFEGFDFVRHSLATSLFAHCQIDAFASILKDAALSGKDLLQYSTTVGSASSSSPHSDSFGESKVEDENSRGELYAPLSKNFLPSLMDRRRYSEAAPKSGTLLPLVGRVAFPCVCEEIPPSDTSLFHNRSSKQSLYAVVHDGCMVLVELEKGGTGEIGHIVTSCRLFLLAVEREHVKTKSARLSNAERLLFHYKSVDKKPPPLFEAVSLPKTDRNRQEEGGYTYSKMDLTFESKDSAEDALKYFEKKISKAKSKRVAVRSSITSK